MQSWGAETWSFGELSTEISDLQNGDPHPHNIVGEFAIAATFVIVLGMIAVGMWLTSQIRDGVVKQTTFSTALYMERYIQPRIQELRVSRSLSANAMGELDRIVTQRLIAQHLLSVKVWLLDGTLVYSTNKSIIGTRFPVADALLAATNGQIASEYGDVKAEENLYEKSLGVDLIEVYAPMFDPETQRLYAVAEFYINANALQADLSARYFKSWLVVGSMALLMILLTSGVVMRGNETIKQQHRALQIQVKKLSALLTENRDLGVKIEAATRDKTVILDQYLQRITADLHDGPAQQLALASLRLNSLSEGFDQSSRSKRDNGMKLAAIQDVLRDAMGEIRTIAAGLTLPELNPLSLSETLELAANMHQHRTGTTVERDIGELPASTSIALKSNLYRFAQEGLNNAFKHASGVDQKLSAHVVGSSIVVAISDRGAGFTQNAQNVEKGKLGLQGLKNRIAILGGDFELKTGPSDGTCIIATVPINLDSDINVTIEKNLLRKDKDQ
jgi:signal transduction histidine kinase